MIDLNQNSNGKNFKSIPTVEFDSIDNRMVLDTLVTGWFGLGKNIEETVGLILLRLGFTENDKIKLCNYDKDSYSFQCIVNEEEICNISFKNIDSNNYCREIVLRRCDTEFGYECIPISFIRMESSTRISLSWYSVSYSNGVIFTRNLSDKDAKFKMEVGNYILELELDKSIDVNLRMFDDDGRYWKYRLNNEEELIRYLTSIEFPISIEDLYKRICEISLGDVNRYPEIVIKLLERYNDGRENLRVKELIHLKYGELEVFGKTIGDKVYFLNKDDSYSCESINSDSSVDFTMIVNGDKVNYNVSFKHGSVSEDDRLLVEYDIGVAMSEIENVKKLARIMIPKKNVNGDSK